MSKTRFRVRGVAKAIWREPCDCPDCTGHEISTQLDVDIRIDACDEDDARILALNSLRTVELRPKPYNPKLTFFDWVREPDILDMQNAQDQLMLEVGAPMLPGLGGG